MATSLPKLCRVSTYYDALSDFVSVSAIYNLWAIKRAEYFSAQQMLYPLDQSHTGCGTAVYESLLLGAASTHEETTEINMSETHLKFFINLFKI
jgi:hypothetical protein